MRPRSRSMTAYSVLPPGGERVDPHRVALVGDRILLASGGVVAHGCELEELRVSGAGGTAAPSGEGLDPIRHRLRAGILRRDAAPARTRLSMDHPGELDPPAVGGCADTGFGN